MSKGRRTATLRIPAQPGSGTAESDDLRRALSLFQAGDWAGAEPLCRSVVRRQPQHQGALTLLGVILAKSGRKVEAADTLGRAAACAPRDPQAHNNHGNALRECGRHLQALSCYDRALALKHDYPDALYNRAVVLQELKRFTDAIADYDRAIALKHNNVSAYNNRGAALQELSYFADAVASYDRALELQPAHASAWNNRGIALLKLRMFELALASFEHALAIQPDFAEALNNRGVALRELARLPEALASFERALAARPQYADAHNNRGVTLRELGRPDEALASCERALALNPDYAEAHVNRGVVLRELSRLEEALASHERALAINPAHPDAFLNRGAVLHDLRRFHEALESHEHALLFMSESARAYQNQALTLQALRRQDEALASYERALKFDPNAEFLRGACQHARMQICDWSGFETAVAELTMAVERGEAAIRPFAALALFDSPRLQRKAAARWAREKCQPARRLPPLQRYPEHSRVRVGYFSADFRDHALSALAAELFEIHDRSSFEFTAFCLGPDERDALGTRVRQAFDRFLPLAGQSDEQIASLARSLQIDIAVDLGGYTQHARPRIFALRAAPIQVSYLGYLGTLGAEYMDYLLADEILVPREQRRHYTEKIAYLPSYQANDSRRSSSDRVFARAEIGLPESGFVFCCLNASYKILPETFASWMRILAAVPDSTLLLVADCQATKLNLRQRTAAAGLNPDRIVFVGRVPYAEYLARFRVADLFLDTLPYNAGTVASDALWSGLPVLTCAGESFAARVGASLLTAVGLPELITSDRSSYERRAIELAYEPAKLASIRARLSAARGSSLLFDTTRLARSLEALYRRMDRRHRLGLLPEHLLSEMPVLTPCGD